ncbi:WbqC family protein [Fulvivirga sedimenti]|uniref:WbqC family protein n=1 Tax=Fulvivirga sedimenti TaxID=2879465 RepID=A0A9X1HKD5_9BACT|nr:WbqC family protein [Fulvivirga sedimenti]MCA6073431.1 WbqC family protein [Fulvivirga sedimenti]
MRLAIMQPYVFPYLGYFQLIHSCDTFVFYDDVNFIKQGWVNRNRILHNGNELMFSVPVKKISSFEKIAETEIHPVEYQKWKKKFLKTLSLSYAKAPNFTPVFDLIAGVFNQQHSSVGELAKGSIIAVLDYLGICRHILLTSSGFNNEHLSGQERVLDICKRLKATEYINVPGGRSLYNLEDFRKEGIDLHFISPNLSEYEQNGKSSFLPGLSVIDVLMNCDMDQLTEQIENYSIT